MSFDIEAYKLARIREAENDAREDLTKAVAALHDRFAQLEQSIHAKLDELLAKSKKKD